MCLIKHISDKGMRLGNKKNCDIMRLIVMQEMFKQKLEFIQDDKQSMQEFEVIRCSRMHT